MKRLGVYTCLAFIFTACATHPDKLPTTYVPVTQYSDLDCDQIAGEMRRVSARVSQMYGTLEDESDADDIQMGVGLILLWPTLFWLEGGDDEMAAEYSRLKGEKEALEQASIQRKCNAQMVPQFKEVSS